MSEIGKLILGWMDGVGILKMDYIFADEARRRGFNLGEIRFHAMKLNVPMIWSKEMWDLR